jgi:trk system potassium uptake protein TrkH
MNIRFVLRQLGLLAIGLSLAIFAIGAMELLLWGNVHSEHGERYAALAMLATAGIGLLLGGGLLFFTRGGEGTLGRREALLLVAVSWLFGAAVAGLPYYLWATFDPSLTNHPFNHFVDCYFEAMSGMTTTGATVLTDIESLPKSLLLWRATTHWVGGLGIVVLFVAVLPTLGVGGKKLFQFEAPGPSKAGVRPRIRETARILWLIYFGLTIAEIIALRLCGMDWFESVCHTFATLATGGFSTKNASAGGYNSAAIDTVIIVFMVLAGINFGLYYQAIRGRLRDVWKDPELRLYFGIILVASIIVVGALMEERLIATTGEAVEPSMGAALRHGVFQVVSIQTTTGFCTADFNQWGFFPKAVLIILMFVGASAGSTGGGIKVIRILIAFKVMVAEIGRVFHPNVVRPVRVGGGVIEPEMRLAVLVYILGIGLLFGIGALLLMFFEASAGIDFTTAATASAATLNNIGPGLARVGAIENFGWFSPQSKIVMSILMALGRLEVYAIFVLFIPGFWRRD